MSDELDILLNALKELKHKRPKFDPKAIWDGIAQRKDFSEMGFTSIEQFESWIEQNPYCNL